MDKMKMRSPDQSQENITKIRELFPHTVTETRDETTGELRLAVNFKQLRQELSDHIVEGPQERYCLEWPGKRAALALANAPTAKTLRPQEEMSKNFDATKNIFIEGDNLQALKLLSSTYIGKIQLIIIDPPYNTGKDFIYSDNFAVGYQDYLLQTTQKDESGNRLIANTEANGRFHSDWLSMIYPRIKLARNLLSDGGIIAVHIDENEYPNMEKILSEIFGAENNLGTIVWDKRNPKGDAKGIAQQHEYISMYAKNAQTVRTGEGIKRKKENAEIILCKADRLISEYGEVTDKVRKKFKAWIKRQDFTGGERGYNQIDDQGKVYQAVSMAWPNKKSAPEDYNFTLIHPETGLPCPSPDKGWRNPSSTMKELLSKGLIVFGKDETTQPRRKYLLEENILENFPSLLYFGGSDDTLFKNLGLRFDNPKPIYLTKKIIEACCPNGGVVLDFFAGSGTTAHAVLETAAEDGIGRSFISVQLDEAITDVSAKADYTPTTISDLSIERIRRAGKKILEGKCHPNWNRDVGFRALRIDTSNFQDVYYTPNQTGQSSLLEAVDNVKEDRTPEDLLFQVLVDWGVDLTLPIRNENIQDKKVFFVDGNALIACFDRDLPEDLINELAGYEPLRAVFRDIGFETDDAKINAEQIFCQLSPSTEVKSI